MHLLIQHAHVVTWVTVIIGMYSIIQMWTSGVIAWLNFRNSKACLEEAVVPPDLGKDGKADTPWSRYE